VFVSSDKDQAAFDEYYGEQPWAALKFTERKRKGKLSSKFGVSGIPTLVFVNPQTGKATNKEGRNAVMDADAFPWTMPPPKTVPEILGDVSLLTKEQGVSKSYAQLAAEVNYIMIYFSAHWCPPCRGFTPKFAEWYTNNKGNMAGTDKSFEVVFASSDRDKAAFDDYYGEQPWLGLDYAARAEKEELSKSFKVQGIPTLVVINAKTGQLETAAGRAGVMGDLNCEEFPWPKKLADFLSGNNIKAVNDGPCLIVFADHPAHTDDQRKAALAALVPAAQPHLDKARAEEEAWRSSSSWKRGIPGSRTGSGRR